MNSVMQLVTSGADAVLDIFGEIGFSFWGDSIDAATVRSQIGQMKPGGTLRVNIDSPGGSVSDAIAIYNIIRERAAAQTAIETHVQGIAASAAGYIAMAADEGKLHMPANTLLMIHKPWLYTAGNADDLRHDADVLDQFENALIPAFARHWTGTEEQLRAAIEAETWYTAAEAADMFGAVVHGEPVKVAAMLDLSRLANVPDAALAFGAGAPPPADPPEGGTEPPPEDPPTPEAMAALREELQEAASRVQSAECARGEAEQALHKAQDEAEALRGKLKAAEQLAETRRQEAEDARAELARVAGPGNYSGDDEANRATGWERALESCGGDYALARTKYPDAYTAYREECRRTRT